MAEIWNNLSLHQSNVMQTSKIMFFLIFFFFQDKNPGFSEMDHGSTKSVKKSGLIALFFTGYFFVVQHKSLYLVAQYQLFMQNTLLYI